MLLSFTEKIEWFEDFSDEMNNWRRVPWLSKVKYTFYVNI
jgi:hypothetical protein